MGWGAEVDSRDHGISAGARPPAPARRPTGHSPLLPVDGCSGVRQGDGLPDLEGGNSAGRRAGPALEAEASRRARRRRPSRTARPSSRPPGSSCRGGPSSRHGRRGRRGDVGPPQGAHLAPTHPRHEEEPCDHRVEAAPLDGDLVGLDAAATPRTLAGSEVGEPRSAAPKGRAWPRPRSPDGPPVAREDPGRLRMDSGDSRGGEHSSPPRVRGRVVEGRAMGWGSGVVSRTTKISAAGHGRRLQHGARPGTAHFPVLDRCSRGLGVRVGRAMGSRLEGGDQETGRRGHGRRLQHGAGTQLPHRPASIARSPRAGGHRRHQDRGRRQGPAGSGGPRPE